MDNNTKKYRDLKKEIVMSVIAGYESRERLILLSEIKNEKNEGKIQKLIELSSKLNQNSRSIQNRLDEVEDIEKLENLKEELLKLTQYYSLLIQEIF